MRRPRTRSPGAFPRRRRRSTGPMRPAGGVVAGPGRRAVMLTRRPTQADHSVGGRRRAAGQAVLPTELVRRRRRTRGRTTATRREGRADEDRRLRQARAGRPGRPRFRRRHHDRPRGGRRAAVRARRVRRRGGPPAREAGDDIEVVALTVGPDDARDALKKALQMGADGAVHVSDEAVHGSDAVGTSLVLAQGAASTSGSTLSLTGMAVYRRQHGRGPGHGRRAARPAAGHVRRRGRRSCAGHRTDPT